MGIISRQKIHLSKTYLLLYRLDETLRRSIQKKFFVESWPIRGMT